MILVIICETNQGKSNNATNPKRKRDYRHYGRVRMRTDFFKIQTYTPERKIANERIDSKENSSESHIYIYVTHCWSN